MTWFSMSHYEGERREIFDSGRLKKGEVRMEQGEKGCYAYVDIISGVRSTSCLLIWVVNSDP